MNPSISTRPLALRDVERGLDRGRVARERLLDEDVLPRLERAGRPFDVERARERDVDGVHVGVREELVVAPVRARDPSLRCVRLGASAIAARDGDDLRLLPAPCAVHDRAGDPGGREEAEPERHGADASARDASRIR
jgi:hypothetical protein